MGLKLEKDPRVEALLATGAVESEPTGFINNVNGTVAPHCTMTFNETTRIFTVTPISDHFVYYIKGRKYYQVGAASIQITNTDGLHFIYFKDDGLLFDDENPPDDILLSGVAYLANIYWNSISQEAIIFGEERHGCAMDWATHNRMHFADRAKFVSGFDLANFTIGDGSLDTHAQFSSNDGIFKDEDIEHRHVNNVLQQFSPILQAPVLYRSGTTLWYRDTATNFPVKNTGTGRIAYNQFTGGVWQQTEANINDYVLSHIVATNDIRYPIMAIQGIQSYATLPNARKGAVIELPLITGLPMVEFVPIATVIYQTANYANTPKGKIVLTDSGANYVDLRYFSGALLQMMKELITAFII